MITNLIEAEEKASELFVQIEEKGLIVPGKSEKELNTEIFNLAFELYGIKKYWHKRIIRAGKNTLKPYDENPENLTIQKDDILFIDFGPIFDEWEADFGRTYVLGTDILKHKLKDDIQLAWKDCKAFFTSKKEITGAELYNYAVRTAKNYGWEFGGEIAGHIIGHFPHEKLEKEDKSNYIHPDNHQNLNEFDKSGAKREWILEIHFVNKEKEIGGFFEQLLT
ncbi:metallopeptidase family M24 [Maribacter vaceletii]|uniref:Metallopeptidase family M24 n=1 Tax=Maribacter vaceletii TaxID=1206816 RepID=A0A495EF47_9FLAO|nr:M24 family metallopeptidase [Maribacter vaceletii]RKR15153.1 metallopeptidase family M24 [Maribacter vaceletii]